VDAVSADGEGEKVQIYVTKFQSSGYKIGVIAKKKPLLCKCSLPDCCPLKCF
jgi:hypothetical protein